MAVNRSRSHFTTTKLVLNNKQITLWPFSPAHDSHLGLSGCSELRNSQLSSLTWVMLDSMVLRFITLTEPLHRDELTTNWRGARYKSLKILYNKLIIFYTPKSLPQIPLSLCFVRKWTFIDSYFLIPITNKLFCLKQTKRAR